MTEKKKTARDKGLRLHKAGHDPRAAALEVLYRVRYAHEDSQTALNDALSREGFSIAPSDKALCTELVYGALRHYPRLRRFAYRFLTRPDKLPEEMRLLLLQTLYEMAYLRIPHHAGVNWAVGHVRHRFGKGLAGVANGALRSMQRELRDYYEPDKPGGTGQGQDTEKPDERLAWRYAMPLWIVRLWRERYGLDHAERLLSASATAPPSGLRLNRGKADWEKTRAQLLGRDPGPAGTPPGDGRIKKTPEPGTAAESEESTKGVGACALAFYGPLPWKARQCVREGRASRQSAAAMMALEAMEPEAWPQPLWDCCAGRGGKTLALLERGIAVALASDKSAHRLAGLTQEYARLGLTEPPCPPLRLIDLSASPDNSADVPPFPSPNHKDGLNPPALFGTILIDAPCSGLGTMARRPEIRLRRTPADCEKLAATQRRILDNAWRRLLPGGCLVYMTCTVNPAENEDMTAAFLKAHDNAVQGPVHMTPFDSGLGEFFYAVRIKKTGGQG